MIGKIIEFGFVLWVVGMFFFFSWAFLVFSDELFDRLISSRIFRLIESKIDTFLYLRRYERQKKEFLRSVTENLAEFEKNEYAAKVDYDKGAE